MIPTSSNIVTMIRPIIMLIVGIVAGIIFFIRGLKWFKERRIIEDIPASKIEAIAMGPVEINGKALPVGNSVFKGPFTGKDCVHYRVTVEKLVSSGRSSRWVLVKAENVGDYFYLKDETGQVLVTTAQAELQMPEDYDWTSRFAREMPEGVSKYVAQNNIQTKDLIHINYTMRFREYDIDVGQELFVFGTAGKNILRRDYEGTEKSDIMMLQKGTENQPFLISEHSKKEEIGLLKRNSILGILGGGALTVGCLFILLFLFNLL